MPIMPQPTISPDLLKEIERAEEMASFITSNRVDNFVSENDEKMVVATLYSLAREHYTAILFLIRDGRFDGSAFALARPLVEAAYNAHWLYCCAKPTAIDRIKQGYNCFPPVRNIAEMLENKLDSC